MRRHKHELPIYILGMLLLVIVLTNVPLWALALGAGALVVGAADKKT